MLYPAEKHCFGSDPEQGHKTKISPSSSPFHARFLGKSRQMATQIELFWAGLNAAGHSGLTPSLEGGPADVDDDVDGFC